ncbi:uncharacterized protein LOC34619008 [Cyclospora cayetanensis]|uniref:tRNA:m(4)X modification enzyme TRM13 n=1 Tax=Cyclospora cayetanensis TaxID=88456 RepID=A0A6P6RQV4_9EIME|nr:uncharacterized protein LOC34619008 [Cyclospora cayetanensis]
MRRTCCIPPAYTDLCESMWPGQYRKSSFPGEDCATDLSTRDCSTTSSIMTTPSPLRAPLPETLSDSGALGDGGAPPSLSAGREGSSGSQQENLRAIVGGRLKRMKPAEEAPGIHSSDSCAAVASCCAPAAGEAGADDHETCEDPEAIGRNRRSSGRHGDRIPCPMDPSHCIYSLRLQAHLKKCTKARDIAFSHCLPFMQPGTNLPLQQQQDEQQKQGQQQQQDHQQQHARYIETSDTAAAFTPQLERKISRVYEQCLKYLMQASSNGTPAVSEDETPAAVAPWECGQALPASAFISKCCDPEADSGCGTMTPDAAMLLRAAADACQVALGTGSAESCGKGTPLASVEAQLQKALSSPRQRQLPLLQQLLLHLQEHLNKHQQQLLQLLSLCLLEAYLESASCDHTLLVELGAGKGDLTRWLGCWSAVAVAATAPSAGAKAFEAGSSSVLLSGEAPRHRGIRCIVVDREARRYRKEAKDKLLRNPNEPRRLHPAAVAAAQRRKAAGTAATGASAVDCNSGPNNPLLEEATGWRSTAVMQYEESARSASLHSPTVGGSASDAPPLAAAPLVAAASPDESSGCNTDRSLGSLPFLPFPPVRLRMDISDFSLSALLQYVRAQGPLRQPHVPGFFNTLFRYGCRFALPPHPKVKPAVEAQQQALHNGAGEPKAEKARSEEGSFSGASAPPAAGRGLPHGPKSRLLRSLADGSTADFFRLAETLGEGGGPNMKKIEEVLGIHFKGSPVVSVLGVAKHLCGSGSDVALRCVLKRAPVEADEATAGGVVRSSGWKGRKRSSRRAAAVCSMDSFVGVDFLLKLGLSLPEISLLFSLSGWATGASDRKRKVGNLVKRILDISRVAWLREKGFCNATLRQFVASEETPECFAITASSHL